MARGRISSAVKFPIGSVVRVYKKSIGTFAEIDAKGTVETEPYIWHVSPGAGPRLCVVMKTDGLCKQVRIKDLKVVNKGELPHEILL